MDDPKYKEMTQFLRSLGTDDVPHSGKGFLAHLVSVFNDLRRWECDQDLCRAGMFHSIYGTEKFQKFSLPIERRDEVQELIGDRAERIAFYNCVMDRPKWDAIFNENTSECVVGNRITGEVYDLSPEDFQDLATLHVCDWLEQVPRSQEWDYRRDAYKNMAAQLGGIAQREYERIFAEESTAV